MMPRATMFVFASLAACTSYPDTASPTVVLGISPGTQLPVFGGMQQALEISATSADGGTALGVAGVTVSLTSTTSGVTATPATVTTGDDGRAIAAVVAPYGTNALVVATAPGGSQKTTSVSIPSVAITPMPQPPVPGGAGTTVTVMFTVMSNAQKATGVTLVLATGTMGVAFVPGSVTTDANGSATSQVLVPYSSPVILANASGGGAGSAFTLVSQPLSFTAQVGMSSGSATVVASNGSKIVGKIYPVTVTVKAGDAKLVGITVTFTQLGATSTTFAPASAITGDGGNAVTEAFVPDDPGSLTAVVSAAGTASAPFTIP